MSTAAAPVDETGGSAASAIDPIDALDLSAIDESVELTSETELPAQMVIGGKHEPSEEETTDEGTATDRGDGRTAKGQFAKKEGDETPEGEATPAQPLPFQYRSRGQTHGVEGATIDPASGNLVIPAAKVAEVQEAYNALHLAKGEYLPVIQRHQQNNAALRARVQELENAQGPKEAEAQRLMDLLLPAFEDSISDEQALSMLFSIRQNFPKLRAEAKAAWLEKQLQAKAQPPTPAQPPDPSPQQAHGFPKLDEVQAIATDFLERMKVHPEYRDVTPDAWSTVAKAIASRPQSYMRPATAEDAKAADVTEGEPVVDLDLVLADIDLQRQAIKAQRDAEASKVRLATQNATRTQPAIAAPPTPGGGRAPIPKPKTPQTKEELDRWFDSDEL